MNKQEFELTKRIFEVLSDLKMIDPKDSKKREQWENTLYRHSEDLAVEIIIEFNKL